jgi:hypothetical protein
LAGVVDDVAMLATVLQLRPWTLVRGAVLEPVDDAAAVVEVQPALSLVTPAAQLRLPGVNIEGGMVDVGGEAPDLILLAGESPSDVLAACRAVSTHVRPAHLLVRDGESGHAVHLGPDSRFEVLRIPWREYLVRQGAQDLLHETLLDALSRYQDESTDAGALDIAREAVYLRPDDPAGRYQYGRLLARLGRDEAAVAELSQAMRLKPPPPLYVDVCAALAEARLRLSDPAGAVAALDEAGDLAWRYRHLAAVALARAGRLDEALERMPMRVGTHRFVDAAQGLYRLGRHDDARALLRVGLMADPGMLDPVAENVWPKPPDLSWAYEAGLGDLVATAIARHDG